MTKHIASGNHGVACGLFDHGVKGFDDLSRGLGFIIKWPSTRRHMLGYFKSPKSKNVVSGIIVLDQHISPINKSLRSFPYVFQNLWMRRIEHATISFKVAFLGEAIHPTALTVRAVYKISNPYSGTNTNALHFVSESRHIRKTLISAIPWRINILGMHLPSTIKHHIRSSLKSPTHIHNESSVLKYILMRGFSVGIVPIVWAVYDMIRQNRSRRHHAAKAFERRKCAHILVASEIYGRRLKNAIAKLYRHATATQIKAERNSPLVARPKRHSVRKNSYAKALRASARIVEIRIGAVWNNHIPRHLSVFINRFPFEISIPSFPRVAKHLKALLYREIPPHINKANPLLFAFDAYLESIIQFVSYKSSLKIKSVA